MNDFIAQADRERLKQHGLDSFEALWALDLPAVDEPNTERGGWSSVYRVQLPGQNYYLKKQRNHLTRSLCHPLGEPTFARELRTIQRYQRLGIAALTAAFYAQRRTRDGYCAVLLTHALDGWQDLSAYLAIWQALAPEQQQSLINACALLARQLHQAGQIHGCFYPKHIFLREQDSGFTACLIDLEKTRPLLLGRRDRIKDLEPLLRRTDKQWGVAEWQLFLRSYLDDARQVPCWLAELERRRSDKESRR